MDVRAKYGVKERKRQERNGALMMTFLILLVTLIIVLWRSNRHNDDVEVIAEEFESRIDTLVRRPFDPNVATIKELFDVGMTRLEALSLLRYRANGKIFHIKEDLLSCYNISDSLYFAIEDLIVIGEEFKYKKREYDKPSAAPRPKSRKVVQVSKPAPKPFLIDTVGTEYLASLGVLSPKQSAVVVKWRDMSGIHSEEELRSCYVVSESAATELMKYVIFTPRAEVKKEEKILVDLNSADSLSLVALYGVGAKSAAAIIDYREKLGGFHSKEQLREIKIIFESNYEKIIEQIFVDSCDISKIDVNFASAKVMSAHPYIQSRVLRKLLKIRELKGGWHNTEEMIEDDIFSLEEAQKVRPYLHFEVYDAIDHD